MLTTKLNYQRIMALNPTVYCTITNTLGQTFDLIEHPTKGDEYTVIIMYHAEKLAVDSEFWDTEDMESNSDYMPVYMYGDMHLAYELDEADLKPTPEQANMIALEKSVSHTGRTVGRLEV
jgi:hypothetical protein